MINDKLKKFLALASCVVTAFAFCFALSGCAEQEEALPEEDVDYEIALVTDDGLVMDGGHSEVAWNAIVDFGGTNGISHKYYKAAEPTDKAFEEIIRTAINKGAKLVIIDNSSMQEVAYEMQKEYPEISFAMTEAEPYDDNGDIRIDKNTVAVAFDSGQAGFLAGYAAVNEGFTKLGFIGQSENDEIKGFGYGYVKGANRAAKEFGITVSMKYEYCSDSMDSEAICNAASDMYEDGVECIFAAGGNIQDSVIEAADTNDGRVIGSMTDQSSKSERVITSAIYNITDAVKSLLKNYRDREFPGGDIIEYNAYNKGIGLEVRNNRLENLTQKQYDAVYSMLAKGEIKVRTDKAESPEEITAPNVTFE
ncbi:MAG: BMP family ABC transporter substrate-binding protein [Clostridia bacterium]|nr:BMP family ABC transporter substrate-binding protein [Clostridia bacterium]